MMRADADRTDLEVADQVRRMYWGAVLARQVERVGKDTLARMEVTLQLTESLYKNSAGKVSKPITWTPKSWWSRYARWWRRSRRTP